MKVQCPNCKASYKVDSSKIAESGTKAVCPKCKTHFTVYPEFKTQQEESEILLTDDQSTFEKKKTLTLRSLLSWFFGIGFLVLGIVYIISPGMPAISALPYFVIAAILLPPIVNRLPVRLSPGLKAIIIIICIFSAPLIGTKFYKSQPVKAKNVKAKSSPAARKNRLPITRHQFGSNWPFSVNEGVLMCKSYRSVVFIAHNKTYAVNGAAKSDGRYKNIREIWRDNPNFPGTKISIGPIIDRGLQLCE